MAIPANYAQVKDQLNLKSFCQYIIINTYLVNHDWLNWNTAWWRGKDLEGDKRKYRYVLWDMDASFDHYVNYTGIQDQSANADPCNPESLAGGSDPEGHIGILNKLNQNETFNKEYILQNKGCYSDSEVEEIKCINNEVITLKQLFRDKNLFSCSFISLFNT